MSDQVDASVSLPANATNQREEENETNNQEQASGENGMFIATL